MTKLKQIINWAGVEFHKLFTTVPAVVKQYGNEALHVVETVKGALLSPTAIGIEAAIAQILPGAWEQSVLNAVGKSIAVTVPVLTNITAHADMPADQQAAELIKYLQTLSPKMQNAGLLKLLSGILQGLDPKLTELEADTAAQSMYTHAVVANKAS